jgi:hypothetical protein
MSKSKLKDIKVSYEVWKELRRIKVEKDFKSVNDVIKYLLSLKHQLEEWK